MNEGERERERERKGMMKVHVHVPTAPVLKAGHLVSYLFCTSVLFVSCMYLDGGMGGGGWLLTSLFLFYYLYSWASIL